eukprot:1895525-Prymnesium_polylepis.1
MHFHFFADRISGGGRCPAAPPVSNHCVQAISTVTTDGPPDAVSGRVSSHSCTTHPAGRLPQWTAR